MKLFYKISIAVTTIVGAIFYGVGLHDSDDMLTYSGVVLIMIGLVNTVLFMTRPQEYDS